ncbi:MAG TPA: peptidoglycan DD-metalloendopeptidase family protein [Clostridia bacterium]|jgi:murein DD-endopeptidase MepM/ murein hydrolase activator NlpD|nr:peptidoglycan DD-metalloendopeptidase family protein [Clostridia bacterium]HRX41947.1 peptidoglycan DD-metalloendopeptidase family protein [Clostridia bacterium]
MKKILLLLLAFTIVFSASAAAENIYDLQQDKDFVDRELEQIIVERMEQQKTKEYYDFVQKKMDNAVFEQEEKLLELQGTVEELGKVIEELTQTIAETELEYNEKLRLLRQRIVDGYIDSSTNMLTLLADSESMAEFYEKIEIRKYITRYDQQLIEDLEDLSIDLYDKRQMSDDLKLNYEVAIRMSQDAIENMGIIRENAEKTSNMSAETIAYLSQREDDLLEESDRLLEEIREMQQKMQYVGGEFIWPVPANRDKLDPGDHFGMRFHPIFHEWRMHTGIDIGAPTGANILASNSGTVLITAFTTGYGNKIVIDHGGGYVTLYAHCSKILVKEGQAVKQGDVIGLVGSTGWSTGPHLHFEIMFEGERINPLEKVNQNN